MSNRPTTEFLRAVSAFRRYTHPERLPDWEQRFAFGLADIEQVFEAAVAAVPVLSAPGANLTENFEPGRYTPSSAADELVAASAVQIAHQVRNLSLSPVKIAELFLGRIEAHRHLNAFITVNPALVMEAAEGLAHRLKRGEDPGPLAGVPVGVKDLMSVRGYPMTAGTKAIEAKIQERDAPVVARLRAAGALIVGTTNLHELAFGINSANPHFGHVQNPRFPGYIPGGSSGGSAAAVAAELAAVAVGSCTGGSIRQPAACCGIVGFKPTYDAVPREGVHPLAWSLDHIGPITRNVEDAAIAFEVMAGLPEHSMLPQTAITAPRIMKPRKFFYEMLDDEVRTAMDTALASFQAAGAPVGEVDVPGIVVDLVLPSPLAPVGSSSFSSFASIPSNQPMSSEEANWLEAQRKKEEGLEDSPTRTDDDPGSAFRSPSERVIFEIGRLCGGLHLFERVVEYSPTLIRLTFEKRLVPLTEVWSILGDLKRENVLERYSFRSMGMEEALATIIASTKGL